MPSHRSRSRTWPQASSSTGRPSTSLKSQSINEQLEELDQELEERAVEIQLAMELVKDSCAELGALEEDRAKLLEARQTLVAPIMKLPYELLARIFEMGNEGECDPEWVEKIPVDEEEDETRFPTVISHVNRRFRDVAITTSSLWSHICLKERSPYPLTRLWLDRAKLIDVDLDLTEDHWLTQIDMRGMLSVIMRPERWRSFSLRTEEYVAIHTALSMMSEPAPELTFLELINAHTEFDEDEEHGLPFAEPVDIFGGQAPKLTGVSLYSVPLRWSAPMLSGLTSLEVEYLPAGWRPKWTEWVNLIRACPGLEKLTVMASGPRIPEEVDPRNYPEVEEVRLDKLEEVELGDVRPWVLSHLINMLRAPKLSYLSLDTLEDYDYTEQIRMVSDARYPVLHRLKFVLVDVTGVEFIALLRRLPSLEQLELNALDDYLASIMDDDKDPGRTTGLVLPKLHTLWATGYDGHQLAAFVEQRKRFGGAVSTVLVPYRDERLVQGGHLGYLQRETRFGYFEGSDREQVDDEADEEEEDASDWDIEVDEEYEDQEDWLDGEEEDGDEDGVDYGLL
ncbi:hypothetical protein CALVIDRAFT_562545 [Calocera viscosa TUFC12733]|uniref:Uncharacterized protein n=1 Tax=Calocera viscosa (strain TUFC12733) TaxID=1330018 RepID=A0A167NWS5_CALVF|nr:hypothetical protein CALVIDRAFT_562545 [Calocera viscosa TUFC12733]